MEFTTAVIIFLTIVAVVLLGTGTVLLAISAVDSSERAAGWITLAYGCVSAMAAVGAYIRN